MIELCHSRRAISVEHRYIEEPGHAGADSAPRVMINARLPLAEVVTDFFDALKHRSSGYASFECVSRNVSAPARMFSSRHVTVMKPLATRSAT